MHRQGLTIGLDHTPQRLESANDFLGGDGHTEQAGQTGRTQRHGRARWRRW
jgi:hypothetical protein